MIIDAHAHLWLKQDTVVDGLPIRTLEGGRSLFMGEVRQMVPPFMVDGVNSAEVFLSNMDYAQVSAAVITQEFIDGIQNDYLMQVARRYPTRFLVCGMCEFRKPTSSTTPASCSTTASAPSRYPPSASSSRRAACGSPPTR